MASIKSLKAEIQSMELGAAIAKEGGRDRDASEYLVCAADLRSRLDMAQSDRQRMLKERRGHMAEARRFQAAIANEDPDDRDSWKQGRREALRNALEQIGRLTLALDDGK